MKKRLEVFQKFLEIYPLTHTLPRGLESLLLGEFELRHPILDVGCGNGNFAMLTFGKDKIEAGLDQDEKKIQEAKKKGVYQKAVVADAQKMPFADEEFKTIIANSALEHVRNSDKALRECFRVLFPGGRLIFTVPGRPDRKYWFWSKFFGRFYIKLVDKLMNHNELYDRDAWLNKIRKAGFKEVKVSSYMPRKTVVLFDFLIPFSLFYYLTKRVFGPRKLIAKLFQSFFYLDKKNGLGYCFVAKKT